VARHEWELRVREVAVDDVEVGTADAACPYADQHLV
jgi:hypothetical protein